MRTRRVGKRSTVKSAGGRRERTAPRSAESREPTAEGCGPRTPWWQGAWQALGGFFNLLAALASRWPKHGV